MRTNVVLNDELIDKTIKLGSFKSKKAAIEAGLRLII
jgi:Arc/MetJ family transcription regulator